MFKVGSNGWLTKILLLGGIVLIEVAEVVSEDAVDWMRLDICEDVRGWWSRGSFFFIVLNKAFCLAFEKTLGIDLLVMVMALELLSMTGNGFMVLVFADSVVGLRRLAETVGLNKNGAAGRSVVGEFVFKAEILFKLSTLGCKLIS